MKDGTKKTNVELQQKMYSLLYTILGNLNERELNSIAEHISSPSFETCPNKKVQLKLGFLWTILNSFSMAKLQMISLKQIIFKQ